MKIELGNVDTINAMQAALRDVDFSSLGATDYRAINRQLHSFDSSINNGTGIKIAYLGNVTLDMLPPYVAAHSARRGWLAEHHIAHYGQYFQALMSPDLRAFAPDIIVLVLSLRLLRPDDMANFAALTDKQRKSLREGILDEIKSWALQAAQSTQATLLIANFPIPSVPTLGIADTALGYGESEFYLELNLELIRRMRSHLRVRILDINRISATVGHAQAFDQRLFHLAKMDWTDSMMASAGNEIVRHLIGAKEAAHKCLVLDLDNTLWGGILGEDGVHAIKVGHDDAESEAFLAFQHRIKALKNRGIILALCSKNNPADVEEAFRIRTEMPLQLADFSISMIGWEAKHIGIGNIASQLNIGMDAIVFMDDSPTEIALIRSQLPQVESVLLPPDPAHFVRTLDALCSFEKSTLLADDMDKAQQYQAFTARKQLSANTASLEDYLHSLQIKVSIQDAVAEDLLRVHQLFSKTNQFNVTTKRYSLGQLESLLIQPGYSMRTVTMRDAFGDLGIIATYLLHEQDHAVRIDSLMMSCRAMGRGVETAIFNSIKQHIIQNPQLEKLTAQFIPSAKNMPAQHYFTEQGMQAMQGSDEASPTFILDRQQIALLPCGWIEVEGQATEPVTQPARAQDMPSDMPSEYEHILMDATLVS